MNREVVTRRPVTYWVVLGVRIISLASFLRLHQITGLKHIQVASQSVPGRIAPLLPYFRCLEELNSVILLLKRI